MNIDVQGLRTGMLVCRLGNGFFSDYFKKYASKEKKYSHIGIISIENDTIFVYHSEASELTGVGKVKREPLNSFLYKIEVFDFFELNYSNTTITKILGITKGYYSDNIPFDLDFNSSNDDELYCTELVANSINKGLDYLLIKPSLELNGNKIFSLDDIYLNKNVKKVVR